MWQSRPPLVAERFAVPILHLAAVLLVVLLAGGNVLAAMPVIAAWRAGAAGAPAERANLEQILSLTVYDHAFWLALLLFNLVVAAMIVALGIESRRLRRRRQGT